MGMKTKHCEICGTELVKKPNVSKASYEKRRFCGNKCFHVWNVTTKRSEVSCFTCGKVFTKTNSSILPRNYCCRGCQNKGHSFIGSIEMQCSFCGKTFRRGKSTLTKRPFCSTKCMGAWQTKFWVGENGTNWRGGVSAISHLIRSSVSCAKWRTRVFKRDGYKCTICGDNRGGNLEAHHITPMAELVKKWKPKSLVDALSIKEFWDISNGVTYCKDCHAKQHKKEGKSVSENIRKAVQ